MDDAALPSTERERVDVDETSSPEALLEGGHPVELKNAPAKVPIDRAAARGHHPHRDDDAERDGVPDQAAARRVSDGVLVEADRPAGP